MSDDDDRRAHRRACPSVDADDEGLSEYERRFVEAYLGEAHARGPDAVRIVSPNVKHGSARSQAHDLLKREHIRKAIRARTENDEFVAGRVERLRLLTRIARGEEIEVRHIVVHKERNRQTGTMTTRVERVETPPMLSARIEAMRDLAKAAGEHLPSVGEDDATTRLMALLSGATIPQLMALLSAESLPKEEKRE